MLGFEPQSFGDVDTYCPSPTVPEGVSGQSKHLVCFIEGNTAERGGEMFQVIRQLIPLGPPPLSNLEIGPVPAPDGPQSLGSPARFAGHASSRACQTTYKPWLGSPHPRGIGGTAAA